MAAGSGGVDGSTTSSGSYTEEEVSEYEEVEVTDSEGESDGGQEGESDYIYNEKC